MARYDWQKIDPLIGTKSDQDLGREFGISDAIIRKRRIFLGIKPYGAKVGGEAIAGGKGTSLRYKRQAEKLAAEDQINEVSNWPPPQRSLQEDLELLRHGPWLRVMPYFFAVNHRDRVGETVPLDPSPLQRQVAEQIDLALECELEYLLKIHDEGGEVYIPNFGERVGEERNARHLLDTGVFKPFEIGLRINVLKSRRGGSSTWFLCTALRACLSIPNYSAISWAEIKESMKRIFKIQTTAVDHWREDIHLNAEAAGILKRSQMEQSFVNGSTHIAKTAGSSTRGDKFDFLHLTEYAHYDEMDDVRQSVLVARPHAWVIKETTANGKNHFYFDWENGRTPEEVVNARREGRFNDLRDWNGSYNIFFAWWQDPGLTLPCTRAEKNAILNSLDEYERRLLDLYPRYVTAQHLKYRREALRSFMQEELEDLSPEAFFDQEYPWSPESAFQSTAKNVFDLPSVDQIAKRIPSDQKKLKMDISPNRPTDAGRYGAVTIYEPPVDNEAYVIGADVAHGVGLDYAEAIIFRRHDGTRLTEVANIRSNTIKPGPFAWLCVVLGYIYNDAFIISEAMGGGLSFCNAVDKTMGYSAVYYRPETSVETAHYSYTRNAKIGVWMNENRKVLAVDKTGEAIKKGASDGSLVLRSKHGIDQLRLYQFDGKKYRAPKGYNDDYVSALMMVFLVWDELPPIDSINSVKKKRGLKLSLKSASKSDISEEVWSSVLRSAERLARRNLRSPDALRPSRRLRR